MEKPDVRGVEGQALGQTMTPTLGAGGGVSEAAPSILAEIIKQRQIEMKWLAPAYEMFYPAYYYPPIPWKFEGTGLEKELEAIKRIVEIEGNDLWYLFLTAYLNGRFDDDPRDVEYLRNLLKQILASRSSAPAEEKIEVKTRSGRTVYIKTKNNKVIVYGDTYPIKEELKKLGFKWDPMERVWYTTAKIDVNTLKARLEGV